MNHLEDLYRMRTMIAEQITALEERLPCRPDQIPLNSSQIILACAKLYDVTPEAILSGTRNPTATRARQAVCWMLRARSLSLPEIGRIIGRDHTTVLHACRKIDADPAVRGLLWPMLERVAA